MTIFCSSGIDLRARLAKDILIIELSGKSQEDYYAVF